MKIPNRMPFVFVIGSLMVRARASFWKTMRSTQVRPFIWVYYIALLAWGIYGTFFGAPPTYVRATMGAALYDVWVWLHIGGTLTVMTGLYLEDVAAKRSPDVKKLLTTIAVRMTTNGHASMFFVLLAYEMSAIYADYQHLPINEYSIFITSPYVMGCLLLTAQGIVRMVLGDEDQENDQQ